MLPYFSQPHFRLGPLTIHGFGLLVAIGVLLGAEILRRRAQKQGLDANVAQRMITWVLVGGFLGAHLVDRLIYFPQETMEDPWSLVKIWSGISSFGGFLGASIATVWFLKREKLDRETTWRFMDLVAYSIPWGWIFGRFGCFIAFDHPGSPTSFFLGQMDEHGIVRHNLGFEEALYTIPLAITMAILGRKPRAAGFFVGMLAVLYTPFRFMEDFRRVRDVRYFGLTPGQYGALAAAALGIFILTRGLRASRAGASAGQAV